MSRRRAERPWDGSRADVIIIGAGLAGLCAALDAAPRRVVLLCPDSPESTSASAMAQGGIAAPLGAGDCVAAHVNDTLRAACHSADVHAVERIIGSAVGAIRFLQSSGVEFDSDGAEMRLHREAGHGVARVAHAAGDRSGASIVAALWARVQRAQHIQIGLGVWARQLVVQAGDGVVGVRVCDRAGRLESVIGSDVVLATGGVGHLFRYTTNGAFASGDGLAMALATGARTAALEFVQFHPTALSVDADPLPLLTEALRGAGATLRTRTGEAVMAGRHPLGDLAPRDTVARAVAEYSARDMPVYLDARAVFSGPLGAAFPGARETASRYGLDPARDLLPITVAAHYHMGGVVVDAAGRSTVPGLWACGEVAHTGLHGANRLASNSLLEAVVCGRTVGATLSQAEPRRLHAAPAQAGRRIAKVTVDEADPRWDRLRRRMSIAMGPVRSAGPLQAALRDTRAECGDLASSESLLIGRFALAAAMLEAALAREESRGAHWRVDFSQREARRDGAHAVYADAQVEFPDLGRAGPLPADEERTIACS